MTSCLICGAPTTLLAQYANVFDNARTLAYARCATCGTVFDDAFLNKNSDNNSNHEYAAASIRFYVELGMSIKPIADMLAELFNRAAAANTVTRTETPRFVDVGCAFGYSLKMAEALGWEAIGVEPSSFGEAGRRMLQVNIRTAYLDSAGIEPASVDALLMSEVIEHVPDPIAVLTQAFALLKPNGVMLMTTPNADVIVDNSEPEIMDVLSPGAHLCIFSVQSINLLLARAGITQYELRLTTGNSGRKNMTVSIHKSMLQPVVVLPQYSPEQINLAFLQRYADDPNADAMVRNGVRYQLVQIKHNAGDDSMAEQCFAQLIQPVIQQPLTDARLARLAACDFDSYLAEMPAYSGNVLLIAAERLLKQRAFAQAFDTFTQATRLCAIETQLGNYLHNDNLRRCRSGQLSALHALRVSNSAASADRTAIDALVNAHAAVGGYTVIPPEMLETFLFATLAKHLRSGRLSGIASTLKTIITQSRRGAITHSARVAWRLVRAFA